MKFYFKFQIGLIFLFCFIWQNTYSQFLYPDYDYKKYEYLPPYDPNAVIISPDVEKWMKEQLAKGSEKRTIEMKTDVLGRTKPSVGKTVQSTKGIEAKQVAEPKQKRLVVIADMHIRKHEIEPMHGRYEYNPETKEYNYYLNSKKVSLKEYENLMEKYYEKFNKQKKGKRDLPISGVVEGADDRIWVAWMTAEEISELVKNYKELAIEDYREPKPTTVSSISSILSTIQLSTLGHNNGYNGNGIGVYASEVGCFNPNYPIVNSSKYTQANICNEEMDSHHNLVVGVVQKASPQAHVYGFNGPLARPANPYTSFPHPLEIGTHSYCYNLGPNPNEYGIYDAAMDDYIYEHNMITFIAAGNVGPDGNCGSTSFHVTTPGKALNAITVGAVHPAAPSTNSYTNYSAWGNSEISEKPELAMYTDIDLENGNGSISGTSAASPLAAGFLATILHQHPFCKRQPAMMKAAFINAERISIQNPNWDQDNYHPVAKGIMNYSTAAWGTGGAWWNGDNSAFFDSNGEIVLTENNIQANKRYRIAIAWLSEGSYIASSNPKRIQQDLDLHVYQNGKRIDYSNSYNNPFEVVDFIAPSNAPLTIIIRRFRNGDNGSNGGRVILGYNINFNH
jgi:hypothetical protein